MAWCGFFGGWLLVAGPIYQASNELREEAFERDVLAAAASKVAPVPKVSGWWWLVPPVYWLLTRARRQRQEHATLAALTPEQREQFAAFMAKASGWLLVGAGAFFIAIKETYELVEVREWHVAVFWILIAVMPVLSFAYTAASAIRARSMIDPDFRHLR
ncbi:MAG: hypothetical protein QOJ72_2765 [Nocardioidaceae bacterium]|jgi:hypothetical protein|nr:hypothetical protein [Nocardioidaceae bacterium]